MRKFILSVASLSLLSVVGFGGEHAVSGKRPLVDEPLGKRYVVCDDGATAENAWFDLLSNKMMRPSLIGANAVSIDFGSLKLSEYDKVSDTVKKVHDSDAKPSYSQLKRPFRFFSTPITFKRGDHWMACAIVSESVDEVAIFTNGNTEDRMGHIVFPNGNKLPRKAFERADGKIEFHHGNIIENPNPAVGKTSADLKDPLAKKYVLCDDGGSKEAAIRDLFKNKLEGSNRKTVVARPVDFKKLALSQSKEVRHAIQDQIWENKENAPYVHIKHPFQLFGRPITFKTHSGVWHACFIVSDEMASLRTALSLTVPKNLVAPGKTLPFTATGGTPPYAFSVVSGGGSIDSTSGLYTAPAHQGTVVIQIKDSDNNSVTETVIVD